MSKPSRPTKGAHAKELQKYAKSLGWIEQSIKNGGHSVWVKDGKKVPIPRCGTQPIASGTLFKILKDLESR